MVRLTGLITIHAGLRKAQVLAGALIGGPRVAHTKFGPIFGVEPASIGTPCIASKLNEIGDSGCLKPFVGGATGHPQNEEPFILSPMAWFLIPQGLRRVVALWRAS